MAEAIGLASSVIAITDVAFKAGSAYLKIIRLLGEMKQVPTELRLKADRVRFIEEFLFYAEDNLSKNPLPSSAWSPTLLQEQLSKCHAILSDVREMVDRTMAQVAQPTSIRRKIALTKAIIHKDDLKALNLKLDEALQLYQLAQEQYVLAMMTYSLVPKAQNTAKNNELLDTTNTIQTQKSNSTNLSRKTHSVSYEPSIFGRFHFSFPANRGIHVVVQAPSWITSTVYSVLAQKAMVGWQMNLRADEMVEYFDSELVELIEDDNSQAMFNYLDERTMSPFVRNWKGETLLYGPLLIKLLGENGLDDHLDGPDSLFEAAVCGIPFMSFRALMERCGFAYQSLPSEDKLAHARAVATCVVTGRSQAWAIEEILFLVSEGKAPGLDLLEKSKSYKEDSLIHTLAAGLVHCVAERWDTSEDRRWRRVLGACFELDPSGVQHLDKFWFVLDCGNDSVDATPLSGMLCNWVCNGIHKKTKDRAPAVATVNALHLAFRLWIDTLASAGKDLLKYGTGEKELHAQGNTFMFQRFAGGTHSRKRSMMRFSILGITYGPLPQHWRLWITNENYDYAGEFWSMIESQNIRVPGSWVEDIWDPLEMRRLHNEVAAWRQEEAPPFIWSEYRKPRQPI
ncbi:hypothetical protein GCG54_00005552 [Colletotrichum gloeosporioides]|uniref:NACHT-NTPase and P-loop NTPases N-terminal domain-containing protein n=1 Tax=Colletotrichum gloeosporioides TaxID=474922 RepID=A0A8H4FGW1_COLGL|nr:uncharacterized protein GCG54_00005552 [Colletotrichum gloeosporioides]KAF3801396.1 hypothetical protein GCG54_00005552 [Colletotrichum gloeosporioides]